MQNSTSVAPYMSSNLREYNRIYKKVNDIYRGDCRQIWAF